MVRQIARGGEHRAVPADHDRQVGAAADLVVTGRLGTCSAVLAEAGGGIAFQHHFAAALTQEIAQRAQRLRDFRGLLADQRDAFERGPQRLGGTRPVVGLHRTILTVEFGHAG